MARAGLLKISPEERPLLHKIKQDRDTVAPTIRWSIPGRDIADDPSLDRDPPRSSGDAGSVWIGVSVEDEGPPSTRLASTARRRSITTPHSGSLPAVRGSEHSGARDPSTDHRGSIGSAGSARVGTSGEVMKTRPRRPS